MELDRLGRSLRHLIDTMRALEERDVGFRSLQEHIDTTTPGGRLVFHVFGALAKFERDLIRERTNAGLAAARARGRDGGGRRLLVLWRAGGELEPGVHVQAEGAVGVDVAPEQRGRPAAILLSHP